MTKRTFLGETLLLFVLSLVFGCRTAQEPYKVMVLGDLHYDAPQYHAPGTKPRSYVAMWKSATPALLTEAASHLDKSFPFVLQLGDIANGDADTVEHQEQMLRDAFFAAKKFFPDHKFLPLKGNHDVRLALKKGRNESNAPAAKALLPLVAQEAGIPELKNNNWAMMQGKDLFLFADGFDSSFDKVKFVREQLEMHPDARYVFYATHLPVFPASYGKPAWLLPDYEKIAKLLASRNAVILAGHTHAFSVITHEFPGTGKVTQLITTSVALNWLKPGVFEPRCRSYADFVNAMKKMQKPYDFERFFPAANYSGYLSYPVSCMGYTILEIGDDGVTALVYNGPQAKPHRFVLLKRK